MTVDDRLDGLALRAIIVIIIISIRTKSTNTEKQLNNNTDFN